MSTPFPNVVTEVGSKLYEVADLNVVGALSSIVRDGIQDRTSAMYVAAMAAAPTVRFLSSLISSAEEKGKGATKETALVVGLILGRMIQPEGENCRVDFTPRNILAAIEAASTVAGFDVKPFIDQKMLSSYQQGLTNGETTEVSLGYWDHIADVGPDFSDFGKNIVDFGNFSKSKH